MSTTNLPPWDSSNFYFDLPGSIPRCSNTTWQYWRIEQANPLPTPPYHALLYTGGYEPYRIQFNNTDIDGRANWTANLPLDLKFGVSMFDSRNYTSGVLERALQITPQAGCNLENPLKLSTLDVEVTGKMEKQCEMVWVNVKNGTSPYKLEITPRGQLQKTIHFATSPLGFVLDISAGVDYWLALYDSDGHSAVKGSYSVSASDIACLGVATTVRAGQLSTLYPGGTTTFTSVATATSGSSHGLARPAIIGIAIAVPIAAIVVAVIIWFCYVRNRRRYRSEVKPEIEPETPITTPNMPRSKWEKLATPDTITPRSQRPTRFHPCRLTAGVPPAPPRM
ncbi:unnamed protein product [Rhizoctonia solani]|uniref:Uncharacterized protein n=1 Tax=Rhizoctonia solani TaxID=456999 RepID=A0A8H2X2Q6_9AGAM|nr:unnamed protein product [Rhizoctonia solani]